MHLLAVIAVKKTLLHVIRRMGGVGLIALGVLDNSFIPLPGGMDAATVLLAAARREPWWYYAIMALIGSLIGGYLTYRIGLKGGQETLDRKLSKKRGKQACMIFERYGFWSVVVTAISPPPVPIVPILIAAGALKYPPLKFLTALALGRAARYALLAYLGHLYGRWILRWLGHYYLPLLYVLIALAVAGSLAALYYWRRQQRRAKEVRNREPVHKVA
jgi:membrane protein YqaA with SNARE-associated domain